MVDQTEIPEGVPEHREHRHRGAFHRVAAIYVGIVAMLLAISALGGTHATKEMLAAAIRASDTYAFAQSKYLRETAYELAADHFEAEIAAQPAMPEEAKKAMTGSLEHYRKAAARYASDPQGGEGRKELLEKARHWEAVRDQAERRDGNFEVAAALFQLAIVLGSVSIAAASPALLGLSAVGAAVATLLTVNGFFLIFHLPLGAS